MAGPRLMTGAGGTARGFPAETDGLGLLHLKLFHPLDDHLGFPPLVAAQVALDLDEGCSGPMRAGRPLLLEGGLDWKSMGLSPKDMDFVEAPHGAALDIALACGVPPMLLGIPGDNTFANYQEANRAFYRLTVLPMLTHRRVGLGLALRILRGPPAAGTRPRQGRRPRGGARSTLDAAGKRCDERRQ
ncbi:phage portal protein [Rhizobium sp. 3T7]|uniref:phage portal protein n=1 Tax=Rhizobium sp. 3T7 TaxID=2874922 RepID=UPI001CCE78D5|nr:phage portal protein [Rhizobium sp. 3T7]MBZ9792823.1 phage portal protein [Rhizobium sp. 3T7]